MRRSAIVGVSLLVAYLAVGGWIFHGQATSWPHEGSWADLVLLIVCPGLLFQAINLAFLRRFERRPARRWLVRIFTIPAGLVLAMLMASAASAGAEAGFERAYQPFLAQVGAHLPDPCGRAAELFAIPSVASYNVLTERDPTAKLSYDGQRFVLAFRGGSIDIDGTTIYYDSRVQHWRRFHNDVKPAAAEYAQITAGLAECSLSAQP